MKATMSGPVIVLPNLRRPPKGYHPPESPGVCASRVGKPEKTVNFGEVEPEKK
jgi:hypothetical protein